MIFFKQTKFYCSSLCRKVFLQQASYDSNNITLFRYIFKQDLVNQEIILNHPFTVIELKF